ncbi:beta-ketoacyl-[acyl-carrier-protein] synthase family protein [Gulosibacter molinativorax]|uniref:Beta-ketoacyl-[acyl-carrier-protein] synthase family protein n=1 Tax=Gulosibacter molinativorax TaxID=256821 RepID=A0ABT7CAN0_9MICO|nr:beta-ketoacyl-[acyl-carrier-protein] synthase family protein [Gulosibacter molinativorax]MDJ1372205.1 beta-ketoacyl-[acyl-carrier-protein] synthase family protein [Gulosibacter molinativorax]QUY60922.1 3-oxoacyl-[acyl-carrier-protein] synthase [Gulosibacter molinativorax]
MTRLRRVVVTGLGAVTPSGLDAPSTWDAVRHGRSGIRLLDGEEFDGIAVRIGGQVRGFDPDIVLEPRESRRLSRVLWYAIGAADEAMRDAGLADAATGWPLPVASSRFAIVTGSGSGPIEAMQDATRTFDEQGARRVTPFLSMHGAPDAAGALLSQRYGAHGAALAISATCASGTVALGEAMRRIRHGYADAALVVGYEDCVNPVNFSSNANMRALASGYESMPERASRPFDRDRSGFVMAAGASAILLEAEEVASDRGATPLAELAGFGAASDAHHATAPHPEARGAIAAIAECLADAGVSSADVDHVNAHGTSTKLNDEMELRALEGALGDHARAVPISATKSSTGHMLGAGGVLEAVIATLTLRDQVLPPTINLEHPEFLGFDFVTEPREARVRAVLSNSFGFGGHNASVLLRAIS